MCSLAGLALWIASVQAAARKPYGGGMQVAYPGEVQTTDPALVTTFAEWELSRQVHETLFRLSPSATPEPALAHFLPEVSPDGKVWTLSLRPGLTFHDDSPITSADVVSSWERLLAPQTRSLHWWLLLPVEGALAFRQGKAKGINGLTVVNRLTLKVRLRVALPEFIEVLSALPTAPLSPKFLKGNQDGIAHPPGSGPFMFGPANKQAPRLAPELLAFPGHFLGRPYLDRLVLQSAGQPRDALMAFEMGKLHLTRLRPARREARGSLAGPANRPVFVLVSPRHAKAFPHGATRLLGPLISRGAMASFLTDVDLVMADGLTSCTQNPSAPPDPGWKKDETPSVAAAVPDLPKRLELVLLAEEEWLRRLAQRLQVDFGKHGLSVEVKEVDRETFFKRRDAREYDLLLYFPLPLVRAASLAWISILAAAEPAQGADEIFQVLRQWEQPEKRQAMLADRTRGLQARLPWYLLFCQGERAWTLGSVRDCEVGPDSLLDYADTWLSE